jgi:hypothetical protein
VTRWPEAFTGGDLDPAATARRMEKLCAKVEALAPQDGRDPASTAALSPAELLAQQWREALAANTMGAGAARQAEEARQRAADQELRSAQSAWLRLGQCRQTRANRCRTVDKAVRRVADGRRRPAWRAPSQSTLEMTSERRSAMGRSRSNHIADLPPTGVRPLSTGPAASVRSGVARLPPDHGQMGSGMDARLMKRGSRTVSTPPRPTCIDANALEMVSAQPTVTLVRLTALLELRRLCWRRIAMLRSTRDSGSPMRACHAMRPTIADRTACIATTGLYDERFVPAAGAHRGHAPDGAGGERPLNSACYMWWNRCGSRRFGPCPAVEDG